MRYATTKQINDAASGRWLDIFQRVSPNLRDAIKAFSKNPKAAHVPCPNHGGKDGFRFFGHVDETGEGICNTCGPKQGIGLIAWAEDIDFLDAKDEVAEVLGLLPEGSERRVLPKERIVEVEPQPTIDIEKINRSLNNLWQRAVNISHTSAEPLRLYLASRGIKIGSLNKKRFRFHPKLPYYGKDGKLLGYYPGLLAVCTDVNDKKVTLHRTFLTKDGEKADVPSVRKMCMYDDVHNSLSGCAVRLTKAAKVLSVAEGLESALSVYQATQMPVWASTTADLLASMQIPKYVEEVWIWADKDLAQKVVTKDGIKHVKKGEQAAMKLCERLWSEGRKARIILPPGEILEGEKSLDWNDILKFRGPKGFPKIDPSVKLRVA